MKKLLFYSLLALFAFSCTADLKENYSDNSESMIDLMAQSEEYHNYFSALIETEAERKADPLDLELAKTMYDEGIDIRTMPKDEIDHIAGAVTYARTHARLTKVVAAMSARFPDYPNDMTAKDRKEMRQRYMAFRGIDPMNLALATR